MNILETERLVLRKLSLDDAAFVLALLNDSAFLRFIGDKKVRTLADARQYISEGPQESYQRHGFGLWLVSLKSQDTSIGICGLIKRDTLADVDIGFAFLPEYRSQGYAFEAASATSEYAFKELGLKRLVAITIPENAGSIRLLEKIGLSFDRMIKLTADAAELLLYSSESG